MFNDPQLTQALITGALVALVGFGLILPALRRNPQRVLLRGTDPKPRDPAIKASRALGLSEWQSGIVGPKDKDPEVLPYMGHHILSLTNDCVAVRAGGGTHAWRFVLFAMILAPPFVVALVLEAQSLLQFYAIDGGNCVTYDPDPVFTPVPTNPFGYITSRACDIALIFDANSIYETMGAKIKALLDPFVLPLLVLIVIPLIALITVLRRTPAPLVFDRTRRLVYTQASGKLWAAPWDGLQMSVFGGPFTTTPAVALFENGTGQGRWFVLAGYHARKEFRAPRLTMLGLDWFKRWDGMRCWLVAYMEQGTQGLHGQFNGRGVGDLLAPRQATLADDLVTRVDALDMPTGVQAEMSRSMKALMSHHDRVITAQDCNLRQAT